MWDGLLYPYLAPTNVLTTDPAVYLMEFGHDTTTVELNATIGKNSNDIDEVRFYRDSVLIDTITDPDPEGGVETYTDTTAVSEDTSYFARVDDDLPATVQSNTRTFDYVYPMYIGSVTAQPPSEVNVKAMTKLVLAQSDQNQDYTITGERFCFAYPAAYTDLASVLDTNLFEIKNDFTKTMPSYTMDDSSSVAYKVYTFDNLTTVTDFNVQFLF